MFPPLSECWITLEDFSSIEHALNGESHLAKASSLYPRLVQFTVHACPPECPAPCPAPSECLTDSVREEGSVLVASVFLAHWGFCAHLSALTGCTCVSQALGNGLPRPHSYKSNSLRWFSLLSCSHTVGTAPCLLRVLYARPKLAHSLVMLSCDSAGSGVMESKHVIERDLKGQPPSGWRRRVLS